MYWVPFQACASPLRSATPHSVSRHKPETWSIPPSSRSQATNKGGSFRVAWAPYGWRKHPVTGARSFHNGVDLRANFEPVYAILPGEVVSTGYEPKGGNYITLRHGNISVTYCHLSVIGVKKGSSVFSGQAIGISGNSGASTTGPHLHIAVKDDNKQTVSAELMLRKLGIVQP